MTRRDVIALPAAVAVVPAQALGADTPVMVLFREWEAAHRAENSVYATTADDAKHEAAYAKRWAIEKRLLDTPSKTPLDVLRKAAAWSEHGLSCVEDRNNPNLVVFWTEVNAMIGGAQ